MEVELRLADVVLVFVRPAIICDVQSGQIVVGVFHMRLDAWNPQGRSHSDHDVTQGQHRSTVPAVTEHHQPTMNV